MSTAPANATLPARRFSIGLLRPLWIGAATVVLGVVAAGADSGDPVDGDADENPPPAMLPGRFAANAAIVRINYARAIDQLDAVAERRRLDAILWQKIAIVDRVCGLTDVQKQKLRLAGRGDNKHLIDRIEAIRTRFQVDANDADKVNEIFEETQKVLREIQLAQRGVIRPGLSPDGSLFLKSLDRLLTTEQAARCAPLRAVLRAGGLVRTRQHRSDGVLEFDLTGTAFADDGLAQLSAGPELPDLHALRLTGTQVTDAGLQHLQGLPQLRELDLSRTQITDVGLGGLKRLTMLKHLTLEGLNERLSDAAVADLKRALPMLEVHW